MTTSSKQASKQASKHKTLLATFLLIVFLFPCPSWANRYNHVQCLAPSTQTEKVKRGIKAVQRQPGLLKNLAAQNKDAPADLLFGDPVDVNGRKGTVVEKSKDGRMVRVDFGDGEIKQYDLRYAKITRLPSITTQEAATQPKRPAQTALAKYEKMLDEKINAFRKRAGLLLQGQEGFQLNLMLNKLGQDAEITTKEAQTALRSLEKLIFDQRYLDYNREMLVDWLSSLAEELSINEFIEIVIAVALLDIPPDRLELLQDVDNVEDLAKLYDLRMEALNQDLQNVVPMEMEMEFNIPLNQLLRETGMDHMEAFSFLGHLENLIINSRDENTTRLQIIGGLAAISSELSLKEVVQLVNDLSRYDNNDAVVLWFQENIPKYVGKHARGRKLLPESQKMIPQLGSQKIQSSI